MTIEFIWAWSGYLAATIVCAITWVRGGTAERVVAATFWIAWSLSLAIESHSSKGPGDQIILIDIVVLVIFTAVSLRTRRLWMLFAAASQVDDVASHFAARLLHYGLYSYITATGIWGGQFIIGCILVGIVSHRRRLKRERRTNGLAAATS